MALIAQALVLPMNLKPILLNGEFTQLPPAAYEPH